MTIPPTSSGQPWEAEDDERLYAALLVLAEGFPGRSMAAVLSRIERNKVAYCRRLSRGGTDQPFPKP
jgi:hypothetical protein